MSATHRARNTANTTFSCRMLQNVGFGTIPWEGGGGGVANREPGSYIDVCIWSDATYPNCFFGQKAICQQEHIHKYAYTHIWRVFPQIPTWRPFSQLLSCSFFPTGHCQLKFLVLRGIPVELIIDGNSFRTQYLQIGIQEKKFNHRANGMHIHILTQCIICSFFFQSDLVW